MKTQDRPHAALMLLLCFLILLVSPEQTTATEPACVSVVRFELDPKGSIAAGVQGKLVLKPVESEEEPLTVEARVGAPALVKLPCSSRWEATAIFAETWGPRTLVETEGSDVVITKRIGLWPLGQIAGSVKLTEKGMRLPKMLAVATLAPRPPASQDVPKGLLDCPVDEQGQWQCPPLPAATFDLAVSAEGFIPLYRWGMKVLPGKTTDFGTVELKRGASVAGWVAVEGGAIDPGCRARLSPLMGPGSGAQVAEKVRSTANEVTVRKDGFFQFAGVAPGNYTLEVTQQGFAPATVSPVEVWPRSETFLREPLVLKKPLLLELVFTPALDWLGRPWRVSMFRSSDASVSFNQSVFEGSADDQGVATIPNQAPGLFRLEVSDRLGNRLYSKIFRIEGPESTRQTIDLEILTIQGTVRLGKEPLAAKLWFGGRYGAPGVQMESDHEGKFHGILPHAGWWQLEIASSTPKLETQTKVKVEVDAQDKATLDIELPATRVFGKVLDDTGRPTPSATVSLSTDDGDVRMRTDESGSFDFRGLSEGMAYAAAAFSLAHEEWTSDRVSIFLRDGEEVGPIELRMRKNKRLSGTVQSALGPVPGAGISVLPIRPIMMFGDSVRTELDGTFTAQVPAVTETAAVIVSPPGHALKAFALPAGEASHVLTVSQEGGDLEILFPEKPEDAEKDEISLWVFQNGLPVSTDALLRWTLGHGQEGYLNQGKKLAVPRLAPGEYRACLAARAVLVAWHASGWTAPLAKCTAGQLTAGGTLQLDLSSD